ncbi:MAG: alcohol dehydrogenase catalytic domain-containing protein, partial [Myxococcota bacterium]
MRRVVIARPGSYDRLKLETATPLEPSPDEIVIDVAAAGVNYADCMVRMGLYASAKEFVGWPVTPGFEVAGTVAAVGANVESHRVGDRVFALTLFNGYASQLCTKAVYAFPLPERMSFEQGAAFPTVYLTAWFALHELAHPRPGAKILVHSAAGGVGGSLVQLAKRAGAEVTGVVGASHKVETVHQHGADHVIDKSTQDLWRAAERIAPEG